MYRSDIKKASSLISDCSTQINLDQQMICREMVFHTITTITNAHQHMHIASTWLQLWWHISTIHLIFVTHSISLKVDITILSSQDTFLVSEICHHTNHLTATVTYIVVSHTVFGDITTNNAWLPARIIRTIDISIVVFLRNITLNRTTITVKKTKTVPAMY